MPERSAVIHSNPTFLAARRCLSARVSPVQTLLDYLESGEPLDVFLDHFPSVSREKAVAALEMAKQLLTNHADPA